MEVLGDWVQEFQVEVGQRAGFLGVDTSDGLHPVQIQNMVMRALSEVAVMKANFYGLKDMLTEVIQGKGTGAGKFLKGFRDEGEKEMVLYAVALALPEEYSKELCGILKYYKEVKMYKQVRNCKNLIKYKESLGDIFELLVSNHA